MAATSSPQTVLVLGGGIGGVVTANRLRRRLDRRHRVVLVDREEDFTLAASYLWVMTGQRTPAQVTRPLRRLERRGIDVRIGTVESIDPQARTVVIDGQVLTGDHLVVSLGAQQVPETIPGLTEHGHTFATLPGARRLGVELDRIESGRVLVATASPIYRCPAAPYEAAFLIDALLRRRGVRDRVEVLVHAAEPAPMGVAGAQVSGAVTQMLAARGIAYRPGHQITGVEPQLARFADGQDVAFDVLAYMPPIAAPAVVGDSALAGPGGWIEADRHTLRTGHENVYAIGDNVQITLGIGKPLPRAGVFAHAQGQVVADAIVAAVHGRPAPGGFDGHGGCFIEIGDGRAGYGSGDFYADPAPRIALRPPGRAFHLGKVVFEQDVLRRWL
jgi:sulfide:quinone oxidoreductase